MIVISELDTGFKGLFAGFLEKLGGALVAIRFDTLLRVDPRTNDEFVANDVGGFNLLGPFFVNRVVRNVTGR